MPPSMPQGQHTLIIGASGAIGKSLIAQLTAAHGDHSVIACINRTPLPKELAAVAIQEHGVSVLDEASVQRVLAKHAATIGCIWMLAAPLSVDTARDPSLAEAVTVGGMGSLLRCMRTAGLTRLCFSDSIGSFGATSPRRNADARWLAEHPTQDPGSDYGLQKRQCRELMREYQEIDTRWAVIPGVLHSADSWGGGTTEYALEAMAAAASGGTFACPIPVGVELPMVWISDLCAGLIALQEAPRSALREPEGGYAIAGFSFTAEELFARLRPEFPDFVVEMQLDPDAAAFAQLWPDTISGDAAARDLEFRATVGLEQAVEMAVAAHRDRASKVAGSATPSL